MSENLIIGAAIFVGMYVIATLAFLAFKMSIRLRERELELTHKVQLDEFRATLERDLIRANVEFSRNADRFEEINHLAISGQSRISALETIKTPKSAFLHAHGIYNSSSAIEPRTIFVLTPFHSDFDGFFETVRSTASHIGYQASRGDERTDKSDIFPQILRGISSSRFIVANITGRNPNVFYELGIAHALDKEVILIAENESDVPFDLQSKRIIFYNGAEQLSHRLSQAIASRAEA